MPTKVPPAYTGRVVVRLAPPVVAQLTARAQDHPDLPDIATLHELAGDAGLHGLDGLQRKLQLYPPDLPSHPVVTVAGTAEILARENQARDAGFPPVRSLIGYFIADPRGKLDDAGAARLLDDLNSIPREVELAYLEPGFMAASPWAVTPDPMVTDQGYLDPAPTGIGANTAGVWGSYDGTGVGFVDLESGWNLKHIELPQPQLAPQPIVNINDKLSAEHGTEVLGVVLAQATGRGITGIAPAAKFLGVSSWLASLNPFTPDIPNAIYKVFPPVMKKGDVLLIEVQTAGGYPVEVEETVLIAIQTAAGQGIVVIEAAGNGTGNTPGRDLDSPLPKPAGQPRPTHSLKRGSGSFIDSYAIMVSACRSSVTSQQGHRRIGYAGFGSRIDCYAWGNNVTTAGGAGNRGFVPDFHGTSAASAIIAGAAILVQQMVVRKGKPPLTSTEMRARLSAKGTGTGVQPPGGGTQVIGYMPDLEAIAGSFRPT